MKLDIKFLLLLFLFIPIYFLAQENKINVTTNESYYEYDTDLLDAAFFAKNREKLRQEMPKNSVAVLFSNPVRNRSNDINYEYHQDPNFYYLTGLREPHAMILIFKEEQEFGNGFKTDEVFFLQKKDKINETWVGKRLGIVGATKHLGFNVALEGEDFSSFDDELEKFDKVLILKQFSDIRNTPNKSDLYDLIKIFNLKMRNSDNLDKKDLSKFMAKLRQVKSPKEITLLRKAINITCEAQIELMKTLNSKMTEYQSEAIIEYVFKKNGAEHSGFPSILGSGENSCVIHYTSNRKKLNNKDLLVCDIGAEYHGYTGDVTRTLPVNGEFSEEEKIIYNIVLKAQQAGINSCIAGNKFWDPHNAATKVITDALLKLEIIKKSYHVQRYFMHGTSHYLGLDVHDAGLYGELEPNNVITVEPGIYIPEGSDCDKKWWNIGIRIEDDVLITTGEPDVLSAKSPRTINAIETLMKQEGSFD
jgi:Xaa-Pro aminopeptidase